MPKIKYFLKNKLFLGLFLLLFASFLCVCFVLAYNPGTNIRICTGSVSQPSCYSGAYPTPTLNWYKHSGTSDQRRYRLQIDNNSSYSSPEIDSGVIVSTNDSYTVSGPGLDFDSIYYWRVRVRDNFGSWTNYAQGSDTLFITAGVCNNSPIASNLSVSQGDYCALPSHRFSWNYSDPDNDPQDKYRFQVDNNSDFSSPEVDIAPSNSSSEEQTVLVSTSPGSNQLNYNTVYYWRVKVWDDQGADSGWVNGSSFSTETHRYPSIDFDWSPPEPNIEEDIQFTDQSTVYGGASKVSWSWVFTDGDPASSEESSVIVQFSSKGEKNVKLEVTDSDGYTCPLTKVISIEKPLPDWRELLPW